MREWQENMSGRRNSKCKGSETGVYLCVLGGAGVLGHLIRAWLAVGRMSSRTLSQAEPLQRSDQRSDLICLTFYFFCFWKKIVF